MRLIAKKIEHFFLTNSIWLFLTVISFISFLRILIVRDEETWESMVYLPFEKWQFYFGYAGSLMVIFLPVLLLSFFREQLSPLKKWLYPMLWLYSFIVHPIVMTHIEIEQYFPYLPIASEIIFVFGVILLIVEILIHFNDYLLGKINIGERLRQVNLEKVLLLLVLLATLYWTYATARGDGLQALFVGFFKWFSLFFTVYIFYWINHYFLIEKIFKTKGIIYYLFAFIGLAMVFFPIFALSFKYVLFQKWTLSAESWVPAGERTFSFYVFPVNLLWAWMLSSIPIILVYQWWKQKNEITQLEKEKSTAELNALKQQINPHFLFNTLNSLYALGIEENSEKTADGIAKLGTLMRYNLNDAQKKFIPLSKEVEYIKKYIELQELRLTKNNQLSVNFLGEILDKQIAPLLLIPFIENAFKFGVSSTEKTKIDLTLTMEEGILKMHLFNTIIRNRQMPEGNGIGISNTRKRLAHLYPSQYELIIEETADEFEVHLEILLS